MAHDGMRPISVQKQRREQHRVLSSEHGPTPTHVQSMPFARVDPSAVYWIVSSWWALLAWASVASYVMLLSWSLQVKPADV